jgi:peptidoglycan L-alanyl-D-glutamate endopeptidase CwlK
MASRKLTDLDPLLRILAQQHKDACAGRGIDLLIYCTYRSNEEQAILYAQGRTTPGPIVTYARPGQSNHNSTENGIPAARAYDCVPIRNGKAIWDNHDSAWDIVEEEGEKLGLSWAGRWLSFREFPHFELKENAHAVDTE